MSRRIGRPDAASQARLQLVLIGLAAWDLLAFLLQLANASLIDTGQVDGLLGARTFTGATAVLAIAYVYAARNPVRHRVILWLASLEQVVALFTTGFHWARGDLGAEESILTLLVSTVFLALLVTNLPRQTDSI